MRIGVLGAGSVGCFVGGLLAHGGTDVVFVGRATLGSEVAAHGLTLCCVNGREVRVPGPRVQWATEPAALSGCDAVLVCVKGGDTEAAARAAAAHLSAGAVVLSLQNGVGNADVLADLLRPRPVWPCMVSFNVVRQGSGRFLQGTGGPLVTAPAVPAALVEALLQTGLPVEQAADLQGVLWGKLVLNLNNAINALSDRPLRDQLLDRSSRRVLASAQTEALACLRAAGLRPRVHLPVPAWVLPPLLRLPTALFRRAAQRMLALDPEARSSMWEDLQRGRKTEVDALNGAVVALGRTHGVPTPTNAALVAAIHAVEAGADPAPLLAALVARAEGRP